MQLFSQLTMTVDPVAVYWNEDKKDRCQIFRDAQAGMAFYFTNNLWEYEGQIFAENGDPIPPPEKP